MAIVNTEITDINNIIGDKSKTVFNESQENDDAIMSSLDDHLTNQYLYYFIGRLNPPHMGHIAALTKLVETANKNQAIPLILLGSGPKGEKTLDNPISFQLKEKVIRSQIGGIYFIEEMKSPATNVSEYVTKVLEMTPRDHTVQKIEIIHMAGDKAQDSTKLDFIKPYAVKTAQLIRSNAEVNIITKAITPIKMEGKEMSATTVRKDAYAAFLHNDAFELFNSKYGSFYTELTRELYDAITEPAKTLSTDEIQNYINNGTLPSSKSVTKRNVKRKMAAGQKTRRPRRTIK